MNGNILPKYLLKFIKEEHLDCFLNKGLYMNAAGYFSVRGYEDDGNQTDIYECLATFPYRELPEKEKTRAERYKEAKTDFDKLCAGAPVIMYNVYKGRRMPIWCCTGIDEADLINGQFKISKKVLKDFFQEQLNDARAVLIDCDSFMKIIFDNPDEHTMAYGYVGYNDLHKSYADLSDSGVWCDSIFIKKIELSYQKEFRVAIHRNCEENTKSAIINHLKTEVLDPESPYNAYEYKLPNIKSSVLKIFEISKIKADDEYLYFDI